MVHPLFHLHIVEFLLRSTIMWHSIPKATQQAVSLQVMLTGSFQTMIVSSHGIFQLHVSRCITAVSDILCLHARSLLLFPNQQRVIRYTTIFSREG